MAHLAKLGELLVQVCDKNEIAKQGMEAEFEAWPAFEKDVLRPRLEARKGQLSKEETPPSITTRRTGYGVPDDDDDDDTDALIAGPFGTGDLGTSQEEMDRLMRP